MTRSPRPLVVAALGAGTLAALVLAGCSSSGSGPADTGSAPASTASTTVTETAPPTTSAPPSTQSSSSTDTQPATSSASNANSDACTNSQLAISAGPQNGAAGHGGFPLIFRNVSHKTCTLHGYPGLDAIRDGKAPVHAQRTRTGYLGGTGGEPTVHLKPGGTASALVEDTSIESGGKSCPTAPKVKATAANTTRSVTLNVSVTICNLQVHPTVSGTQSGG